MNTRTTLYDFTSLLAKAIASGIAASLVLALITLTLAGTAHAAKVNDTKTGTLLFRTGTAGEFTVAPRVETEVAIQVRGIIARTRVTQVFHNPGPEFVEGLYVFPLPEKAAVDRLWLKIGERAIEGQVREKEEARRVFEQAKSQGKKAALIEQQRPNLFTNAVAHIGPHEVVRITIEYQQALSWDNGQYSLRFPLAVTPRYSPSTPLVEAMPEEPKDSELRVLQDAHHGIIHPAYARVAEGVANPVDIVVTIDAGAPLAHVKGSYHEMKVEKAWGNVTIVSLVKAQEAADHDFELTWSPAGGKAPEAAMFVERKGKTDYALLMVLPPDPSLQEKAAFARIPRETILVVDTSGSMNGGPMEQAKAALLAALDTLAPTDRFNVIEFNSIAAALFPDAVPVTEASLAQAKAFVKQLKARGGTEMALALKLALNGRDSPGVLRQVIFATDGAVSNEDELLRLIHERLGASRLFTIGIGAAPNGHFMTKAAQFGRGTFTYIADLAEVQLKMAALFAKVEAPVLKDVAIRWADGTPVETFPARVPDLYLGEPIVVSAAAQSLSKTVMVSGLRGNQPWSVALTPTPETGGSGVGALWARARIASLMDELRTGGDLAAIRPKVVEVALEHHLVSAYTSLVAVDVTPTAPAGATKPALVKANLPKSWEVAVGTIPQTDTASTLQLLLGLFALAAAAIVAVIGRTVPAAGKGGVA